MSACSQWYQDDRLTFGANAGRKRNSRQVCRTWEESFLITIYNDIYHVALFVLSSLPTSNRNDTMQIRNWPSYHPLLVFVTLMGAVTIASTLQRQLPNDPWNLRPNQLVLINPDDYSPLQPVQVVKNLRSTKEREI